MRFTVWTAPLLFLLFVAFGPLSPIPGLGSDDDPAARIPWWLFGLIVIPLVYLAVYPWRYGIWLTPDYVVIRSWFRVHRIAREEVEWVGADDYWGILVRLVELLQTAMLVVGLKSSSSSDIKVKEFFGTLSGPMQIRLTTFAIRRWLKRAA